MPIRTIAELFTNAAFPTFFGAVLAVLTILAGVTRVGTCTGCGESVERNLTDEKG